jgi:hypothetical protein
VKIAIAHAAWMPERGRTLKRLAESLHTTSEPFNMLISRSEVREHASVWARRLWEYAGDDAIVCLNDDVTVHPKFVQVIEALTQAVPDQIISLHCTSPVAPSFAEAGERWLRSYWCTGPGYILPPGAARRLLAWIDTIPQSFVASVNEDNLIMHWAWHEQRPIWHCIPALVQHDTSTRSSLGYDNQAAWMRSSPVAWDAEMFAQREQLPMGVRADGRIVMWGLTEPRFWLPDGEPMLVECPWMIRERLSQVERLLYDRPDLCSFCHRNDGRVASQDTGAKMCKVCLLKVVSAAMGGVQ